MNENKNNNYDQDCQYYRMLREKNQKELEEKNESLKLFNYDTVYYGGDDGHMDTQIIWDVVFCHDMTLALEKSDVSYNPHNISIGSGRSVLSCEPISFEDLPSIIEKAKDKYAKLFMGMNENNWREYVDWPNRTTIAKIARQTEK